MPRLPRSARLQVALRSGVAFGTIPLPRLRPLVDLLGPGSRRHCGTRRSAAGDKCACFLDRRSRSTFFAPPGSRVARPLRRTGLREVFIGNVVPDNLCAVRHRFVVDDFD
jgi:hypothetical protein